ncbi:MAG: GAF domain-containing protein [Deltaproteobacteria bacterium]|nr:GAF domain-containing protein [Deltaproteobacteria bacterium]
MIYKNTKQVLTALHQISCLTMAGMSREEFARTILETVTEALFYDRVALYILREGSVILEGVINVGCQVSVKGLKYDIKKDQCVETRVVRTGEIIRIREGFEHDFYTPLDRRRNQALKRTNCVLMPVITERGIVGTMLADRSFRQEEISDDDIEILEIFCNQIGVGIENRRLNAHNRRQIAGLIELQRISRQMSEASAMTELQQIIVTRGAELGGAQAGWLLLNRGPGDKLLPVSAFGAQPEECWNLDIKSQLRETLGSNQTLFRSSMRISTGGGSRQVGILSLPLLVGKREQSLLVLLYREAEAPPELNVDLLKVFASQADKAMESLIFNRNLIADRDFRESILRSSPNAIITLDSSLRITSHNRSCERIFASLNPDWQGTVFELLDSPSFRRALAQVGGRQQALAQLEMWQKFDDSRDSGTALFQEKIFSVSVTALGDAPGIEHGLLVLVQDQTEKRKTDQDLERMRRLASIGQLAAGIAHEIRNPLTGMNISLDIISNELTDRPHAGRLVSGVVEELDRLENIVSSMLEFSRAGILDRTWVNVGDLLLAWFPVFREQARRLNVNGILQIREGALPAVYGDREKIKQVILNLGLNALDAAQAGGGNVKVVLDLGHPRGSSFFAEGHGQDERPWLWLRIVDDGPGMSRHLIEKIYDPFFTTKNRGTGLGLSIVHSIIKEHGGRLEVESEPGRGSTFAVGLPAGEAQPRYQRVEDVQSNTYN